jgi:hypothetical protein
MTNKNEASPKINWNLNSILLANILHAYMPMVCNKLNSCFLHKFCICISNIFLTICKSHATVLILYGYCTSWYHQQSWYHHHKLSCKWYQMSVMHEFDINCDLISDMRWCQGNNHFIIWHFEQHTLSTVGNLLIKAGFQSNILAFLNVNKLS